MRPSRLTLAQPEDALIVLYTSGTTGLPKGAVISHRAMVARALISRIDRPLAQEDAYVAWGPMFHMGATDYVFSTLLRGGKVIVLDGLPGRGDGANRCHRKTGVAASQLSRD